jgi:hypothetical protein
MEKNILIEISDNQLILVSEKELKEKGDNEKRSNN